MASLFRLACMTAYSVWGRKDIEYRSLQVGRGDMSGERHNGTATWC
jgi:hypothetical protein